MTLISNTLTQPVLVNTFTIISHIDSLYQIKYNLKRRGLTPHGPLRFFGPPPPPPWFWYRLQWRIQDFAEGGAQRDFRFSP